MKCRLPLHLLLLLFPLSLLVSSLSYAQKIIKLDHISYLRLSEGEPVRFYEKRGNQYRENHMEAKEHDDTLAHLEIDTEYEWQSLAALKQDLREEELLLPVAGIMPMQEARFVQRFAQTQLEWTYNDDNRPYKEVLLAFTPFMWMNLRFEFDDEPPRDNDTPERQSWPERWRLDHTRDKPVMIVDMGHDRRMMITTEQDYVLFTKNGKTHFSWNGAWYPGATVQLHTRPWQQYRADMREIIRYTGLQYYARKERSGKYGLYDALHEKVLAGQYDTVYYDRPFIIALQKNKARFFDPQLNPLPLHNVRAWQITPGAQLQVLQGNEMSYIDPDGKRSNRPRRYRLMAGCGTVDSYGYLLKDTLDHYQLQYHYHSVDGSDHHRTMRLEHFDTSYQVRFVNNTLQATTTNSMVPGLKEPLPVNWLIVSRNNKQGLYSFSLARLETYGELPADSLMDDRGGWRDRSYCYAGTSDTPQQILPVEYDSIVCFKHKLLLYKNASVTLYPFPQKVWYKSFGETKGDFIRFVLPDRKRGWLHMDTGAVYPDL